jgi:hypothetical protein
MAVALVGSFDFFQVLNWHWALPDNCTTALVKVERAPSPALPPITPERPMVAVSTVAPFCITATSETMPVCGK